MVLLGLSVLYYRRGRYLSLMETPVTSQPELSVTGSGEDPELGQVDHPGNPGDHQEQANPEVNADQNNQVPKNQAPQVPENQAEVLENQEQEVSGNANQNNQVPRTRSGYRVSRVI